MKVASQPTSLGLQGEKKTKTNDDYNIIHTKEAARAGGVWNVPNCSVWAWTTRAKRGKTRTPARSSSTNDRTILQVTHLDFSIAFRWSPRGQDTLSSKVPSHPEQPLDQNMLSTKAASRVINIL